MKFFAEFNLWLESLLQGYVASTLAALSLALEPVFVVLGTLYVVIWGYLQLSGKIQEPLIDGAKRILTVAVVFGVGLRLWLYNEVIVDTFFEAPSDLTALIVGAQDPVGTVDTILSSGMNVAQALIQKGNVFNNNISFFVAGFLVYLSVGLTTVYTIFLLSLSKIALSLLLALGPGFVVLLLFESTRRFFEAWLAQLTNYALIAILVVLAAGLMLHLTRVSAAQALAVGGGIEIAHAIRVSMTACLAFLIMRQVTNIAAGLASGLALSSFNAVSNVMHWGTRSGRKSAHEFGRGLVNPHSYAGASLTSRAGSAVSRKLVSAAHAVRRPTNSIRVTR